MTPAPLRHLSTRDGYDLWSKVYDGDGNPLIILEERHVAAMLGDVRGLSIADIGCGTGRHALRLAAAGANVTALDFSGGMLSEARRKHLAAPAGQGSLRLIEHDLARPLPLDSGAFDRVLCCLVLDHIADVESLFRELGRIAHPSPASCIIISAMHPAMMLRGVQARFTDPQTGLETRPASVANQISDYVMAAVHAGLSIEHMSEYSVDDGLVAIAPRAEKHLGWPMLLMMRLTRA